MCVPRFVRSADTCGKPVFMHLLNDKEGAIRASTFLTYDIGSENTANRGKPVCVRVHPASDSRLPDSAAAAAAEIKKLMGQEPVYAAVERDNGVWWFFVVTFA